MISLIRRCMTTLIPPPLRLGRARSWHRDSRPAARTGLATLAIINLEPSPSYHTTRARRTIDDCLLLWLLVPHVIVFG
jgi:hypothetical protein